MKHHLHSPASRFTRPPTALLLLTALLLSGCKKETEEDKLPRATQEGKNTMGCLVDGQAWMPANCRSLGCNDPVIVATWRRRSSDLNLYFDVAGKSSVSFFLLDVHRPGTFALDQVADPRMASNNPSYGKYKRYNVFPVVSYQTGPGAVGTVSITRFDTVACIAAGTFEFEARDGRGSSVELRQGRFDVRFNKTN